jgi:hypothetical protein
MFVILDTRYGMAHGILLNFPEQCYAIHSVHATEEEAMYTAKKLRENPPGEFLGPFIIVVF